MEALQLLKYSMKQGQGLDFTFGFDIDFQIKELESNATADSHAIDINSLVGSIA